MTKLFGVSTILAAALSFSPLALAGGHHLDDNTAIRNQRASLNSCLYNSPHRQPCNQNGGGSGNHGGNNNNQPPLTTIACGDVITSSIRIANDLTCADTGFAISIKGDNVKVDGNGHSISAPNAIAAVYIQGNNDTLSDYHAQGVLNGEAVFAYDSPGLTISNNNFSKNGTGILIYAEQTTMNNVTISNNIVTDSLTFGMRAGQDGAGSVVMPQLTGNDFSRSQSYAVRLQVTSLELDDCDNNVFKNSVNGIYLQDGTFLLQNLSLSRALIQKAAIFVDSAISFTSRNLDVSSSVAASASQERIGLDLYRCAHFDVSGLIAINNDVGLKLETENGASPSGSCRNSFFSGETFAAIMITSYDGTPYGNLDLSNNNKFCSVTTPIFTTAGTIWTKI